MPIKAECPGCYAKLKVSDEMAGTSVRCPKCKGSVPVPMDAASAPIPLAAPDPAVLEAVARARGELLNDPLPPVPRSASPEPEHPDEDSSVDEEPVRKSGSIGVLTFIIAGAALLVGLAVGGLGGLVVGMSIGGKGSTVAKAPSAAMPVAAAPAVVPAGNPPPLAPPIQPAAPRPMAASILDLVDAYRAGNDAAADEKYKGQRLTVKARLQDIQSGDRVITVVIMDSRTIKVTPAETPIGSRTTPIQGFPGCTFTTLFDGINPPFGAEEYKLYCHFSVADRPKIAAIKQPLSGPLVIEGTFARGIGLELQDCHLIEVPPTAQQAPEWMKEELTQIRKRFMGKTTADVEAVYGKPIAVHGPLDDRGFPRRTCDKVLVFKPPRNEPDRLPFNLAFGARQGRIVLVGALTP